MASGARLLSTEANREDVRQAQEFLQKWEEAHKSGEEGKRELEREEAHASSSSSSPSSPVHITTHTDDDDKSPTKLPDVNAAQRKKSLAQLDRLQIADDEFVSIIRVEAKYAECLILDSRDTVVGALFGKRAGKCFYGSIGKPFGNVFAVVWALSICAGLLCMLGVLPSEVGWVSLIAGMPNIINAFLLSNQCLMRKLLTKFEVLYLAASTTMATVGMFDVFSFDGRAGFTALVWAGSLSTICSDAGHSTHRKGMIACTAFCIIGFLIVLPSFYFGAFPNLNARNINLSLSDEVCCSSSTSSQRFSFFSARTCSRP